MTQDNETRRLFGLILIVAGVLWLAGTGLCTLVFGAFVVQAYGLTFSDLQTILLIAAPSTLIGLALYFGGRRLRPK